MEPTAHSTRVRIENLDELSSHGLKDLRADALAIAQVGLTACDGAVATANTVELTGNGITVAGVEYELAPGAKLVVLGAGKATLPIAEALEDVLGDRIDAGAVILRRGEITNTLRHIEVFIADHPLPTRESVEGAIELERLAGQVGPDDLVLACFTGGSSALASLPPEGITFEDKRRLHEMLLGSGMPIAEVNAVRKHVSTVKGGRLAARIAPARIINLTVSDVAGDTLDVITDPTVRDTSTVADAVSVLEDYGLWDQLPASIQSHLKSPKAESPDLEGVEITTELLVTGIGVCEAMVEEAKVRGYAPVILTTTLEGEAREMGRFISDLSLSSSTSSYPFAPGTVLVGCGSENSVAIAGKGAFGNGGPGQEAALAAAMELDGAPIVTLFMDTDGSDGGTEAAGAVADGKTVKRAGEVALDLRKALMSHSAKEPFERLGDLIMTGATGTNVNDLFVAVIGETES
ncbi:MAG: glycerate kinase type-2 family protein [Solirubrobacterales bacterium]